MVNRRNRINGTDNDAANPQRNRIRGPHSALTDFLASNNIDANQIRRDYEQRRQAAEQEAQENAETAAAENAAAEAETEEAISQSKKRKRQSQKAVDKIKASKKKAQKRKQGGSDDDDDDDPSVFDMYAKSMPMPGQLENCAICHKRFTVTSYSKAGPLGGLLCPKCSKEAEKDEKKAKPRKKPISRANNRQIRSDHLDGLIQHGAKKLLQLCIQKIANSINDVEDFGELPPSLREALSRILTKKRIMNSRTLDLMLNPAYDTVTIYDAASLTTDDFLRIFAIMPSITHLRLDNAGQFKDSCLALLTSHPAISLTHLSLSGCNLIAASTWTSFFTAKGAHLRSLSLSWIDGATHFSNATLAHLIKTCPHLTRLKLHHLFALTSAAIPPLATLPHLTHLSLQLRSPDLLSPTHATDVLQDEHLSPILTALGPQLQTLSLRDFSSASSDTLSTIHTHCRSLTKLRITAASLLPDASFVSLFTAWPSHPMHHLDFTACRHVNAQNPHDNDDALGLCSAGFLALMAHSGSRLETLTLTSCRHISNDAFSTAFIGEHGARKRPVYPALRNVCVSFCGGVDDSVVEGMFATCPKLERLKVFGCFGVKDVKVPRGVVLLGRSGAADELAIEGEGEG